MGNHTKNSKKSPYTNSNCSSLKLILLVDGCQCDYITKSKTLVYTWNITKTYFIWKFISQNNCWLFSSLETKNYEWIFVFWNFEAKRLRNLAAKKTKKINQLPPTLIKPKVIEVFEYWILKEWGSAECRNRYCVFSCPHLQTLERERERARGLQFAFCMMQEQLH
jgi:hypothetical protein